MRNQAKIVAHDGRRVTVEIPNSVDSSKPHRVDLPDVEDFELWQSGVHVQKAFPYLDKGVREIFITGIGPDDWAVMFPSEEDE